MHGLSDWLTLALLFCVSIACDVGGQLCFKRGVTDQHAKDEEASTLRFWLASLKDPWLLGGVAIYIIEIFTWLAILERAPLSLAFPLASLNYCGILLASRFLLGEQVGPRRWAGAALITVGVVIVGVGADF